MSHTKIIPTQYGFEVELPKGKLAVDNVATFPYPHYGHFIQLRTDRQTLEVYASATGIMHGCAMTLDHVGGALADMERRGAIRRDENSAGVEIWTVTMPQARAS